MGKRGNGEGSVYFQETKNRWAAAIVLENGKRKMIYGKTRQIVAAKLTTAIENKHKGLPVTDTQQRLGPYLQQWLETVIRPNREPKTFQSYEQVVRLHLIPSLGKVPLAKLTPQEVQALLNSKRASRLSPRSVQYLHAVLRIALNQAVKWGLVGRNVALLVEVPKVRRPKIKPFSAEQARSLLDAADGHRHRNMLTVMLATGLRLGEVLALRWVDIDLAQRTLTVRHTLEKVTGKPWRLKEPKSESGHRTLPLLEPAVVALRAQQSYVADAQQAAATWHDNNFVFPSSHGTPLSSRNVERDFALLLQRAGLPHRRLHDLRHSTGTYLIAAGVHPRVVMELLGHSQISVTMDTYGHVLAPTLGEAVGRLEALFTR
jgi:integrase